MSVALQLQQVFLRFPYGVNWRGRPQGYVHALNGIDLTVARGETLGIVGESGCGKSTLAMALLGLLPLTEGTIERHAQGDIQIVFQDPQSSLNGRMPVWRLITEALFARARIPKARLQDIAAQLLEQVGLRADAMHRYAHEFSGGQRQRIAIARALACKPDILILDEPTSALDISVQAQILNLLADLQTERQLTYLFISHNVSVVRHVCDRIAVMYLGQIVELGTTAQILEHPQHPYTRLLLDSVPALDKTLSLDAPIEAGELPSNRVLPTGCFFAERCALACAGCGHAQVLRPCRDDAQHQTRCHVLAG